jgi:hypothetical protein
MNSKCKESPVSGFRFRAEIGIANCKKRRGLQRRIVFAPRFFSDALSQVVADPYTENQSYDGSQGKHDSRIRIKSQQGFPLKEPHAYKKKCIANQESRQCVSCPAQPSSQDPA